MEPKTKIQLDMLTFLKRTFFCLMSLLFLAWLISFILLRFEQHEYTQISDEQRQQATEYLVGKIPSIPVNWQWSTFTPEPGIELRTGLVEAPDTRTNTAKGTVILVPGFTGTIEMSMHTITKFNQAGFRVAAIEYRGQGKSHRPLSHPEKGYVEDYSVLANDVAKFVKTLERKDEPIFFFSISKGAHITLRLAAEHDLNVTAYALVVPMVKINTGQFDYGFTKVFAHTLNTIGLGQMYAPGQSQWPPKPLVFGAANGCNSNPETAQIQSAMFALDETLRTRGTTVKWLKETISSTDLILSDGFMNKLTQPVKIFTAGDDRLVDTEVATNFCSTLANCEVTHFPEARHCIHRENQERMTSIVRESITHYKKAYNEQP